MDLPACSSIETQKFATDFDISWVYENIVSWKWRARVTLKGEDSAPAGWTFPLPINHLAFSHHSSAASADTARLFVTSHDRFSESRTSTPALSHTFQVAQRYTLEDTETTSFQ